MYHIIEDMNRLVICKSNYSSEDEFENEIKKAIKVLLDAGYIMTVKYDAGDKEMGIVVIDYNYEDLELGTRYPYWLSPEESESIIWDDEKENE